MDYRKYKTQLDFNYLYVFIISKYLFVTKSRHLHNEGETNSNELQFSAVECESDLHIYECKCVVCVRVCMSLCLWVRKWVVTT